jgi:hypothetical protein
MKTRFLALLLVLVSPSALAVEDLNRTVDRLGTQAGGASGHVAYISALEGWSGSCAFGVVYLDLNTVWGRAAYASALAAKLAGKRLSRVTYDVGSGFTCTATLIEVQE